MNRIPLVDLKAQYTRIQPDIDAAIARVIGNTSFIGGKEVSDFEAAFSAYQRSAHGVGIASGTAALFLALKALGIGGGDEVITSSHTFMATIEAIMQTGARPVFADIDPATFNLDPNRIEAAITPHTKAIMPVHLYGQMADMTAILQIAQRHGLRVIEDAAQAHGAEHDGKRAGEWGDIACFSFYPGKNLGAYGDAGAICTNDPALAKSIAKLRDHGRMSKYEHDEIGYGERLDALQAAILGAKLPHLDGWNDARRRIAAQYTSRLAGLGGVCTPYDAAATNPAHRHSYHIYCISVAGDRDAILGELNARGVGAGVHYPVPAHLQPAMHGEYGARGAFPHTEAAARSIISLPIYPEMAPEHVDLVAETLADVMHEHARA